MTDYSIVLIDDLRSFKSDTDAKVIRTAIESVEWLTGLTADDLVKQLWLDHDLGEDAQGNVTSIMDFVQALEEAAFFERAPQIEEIIVHTSNSVGGRQIIAALERFFTVKRVYAGDYLVG